jgi:hypothetical protein
MAATFEEALMRRSLSTILGAALVCGCGGAFAQGGDLSGVTMRVLDDVSEVHNVILGLDASRSEGEQGAEGDGRRARGDEAQAADAERAPDASAEAGHLDERRDRAPLHDPDDDERSEGKLEDNDVEQPAVPPVP